jgi:hypothetical protein
MTYNNGNQPSKNWAEGYIDVATRIVEFRSQFPNGSLRPYNPEEPIKIININDKTYLQYIAVAYRTPDDQAPGIGIAWELIPGKTPFTRDSEAMVAETSAWGRAIVAALAADTKKGIASADEIMAAKSRQANKTATKPETKVYSDQDLGWQSKDEEEPIRVNAKKIQRIQILRNSIPSLQDDELYHKKLLAAYGVISTKDLTEKQADDLIKKLESTSTQIHKMAEALENRE